MKTRTLCKQHLSRSSFAVKTSRCKSCVNAINKQKTINYRKLIEAKKLKASLEARWGE